jgi:hypothetical protein
MLNNIIKNSVLDENNCSFIINGKFKKNIIGCLGYK